MTKIHPTAHDNKVIRIPYKEHFQLSSCAISPRKAKSAMQAPPLISRQLLIAAFEKSNVFSKERNDHSVR